MCLSVKGFAREGTVGIPPFEERPSPRWCSMHAAGRALSAASNSDCRVSVFSELDEIVNLDVREEML